MCIRDRDLIVARENVELKTLISYAYPYLYDNEKISDSVVKIKDCLLYTSTEIKRM